MKRAIASILAATMAAALLLSSCSSSSGNNSSDPANSGDTTSSAPSEPVEVVVWNTFSEHQLDAFQAIVDEYNASQDEVEVVVQAQPYNDFDEKLMQAVRNGTGPDIALDYAATVANYLSDGFVADLSQYIDDSEIGIPDFESSVAPGIYEEASHFD